MGGCRYWLQFDAKREKAPLREIGGAISSHRLVAGHSRFRYLHGHVFSLFWWKITLFQLLTLESRRKFGLAVLRLAGHILTPTSLEANSYSTLVGFLQFILDDDLDLASQVKVHPLITQYHASNTLQRQMLDHIQQGYYGLNAIGRPISYATVLQGAASHPGAGSFRTAREKYGNSLADVLGLAHAVAQRISSGG